jgi:hypothetical protein
VILPRRRLGTAKYKLPPGPRIRYTRKSTEAADRQVASHDQQYSECDKHFGAVPQAMRNAMGDDFWFRDDKSGTTFDRVSFQRMVQFCLDHPQVGVRGKIEVYDHSRWGRPVRKDRRGRIVSVDIKAFYRYMYRLEDAGWEVVFTTGEKSEDELAAFLKEGIEIYIAGQKSANLSREVTRGRRDWIEKGRWQGGPPPFPAKRVHPDTGTTLPPGVRAYNGGSVLAPDEEKVPHWLRAADQFLKGWSLPRIAQDFNDRGIPTYYAGRMKHGADPVWTYTHIKKILTNRALISEIHYKAYDGEEEELLVAKAAWEPIVPVDIFNAVQAKMARRGGKGAPRGPRRKSTHSEFIAPLVCARCGTPFIGAYVKQPKGYTLRRYRHRNLATGDRETRERMIAAGCRAWQTDAEEIENAIKDLIVQERMSNGFVERLREMVEDKRTFSAAAAKRTADAKAQITRIQQQQQEALRLKTMGEQAGLTDEAFVALLKDLQEQHRRANDEYQNALDVQKAAAESQEATWELFDETQAITLRWASGSVEERQAIFDWWLDAVLIDFESAPPPTQGAARTEREAKGTLGQRSDLRRLTVFLSTAPTHGMEIEIEAGHWNRGGTFLGTRKWERVEIRSGTPPPEPEGGGTSILPTASEGSDHNAHSRTTRSASSLKCVNKNHYVIVLPRRVRKGEGVFLS